MCITTWKRGKDLKNSVQNNLDKTPQQSRTDPFILRKNPINQAISCTDCRPNSYLVLVTLNKWLDSFMTWPRKLTIRYWEAHRPQVPRQNSRPHKSCFIDVVSVWFWAPSHIHRRYRARASPKRCAWYHEKGPYRSGYLSACQAHVLQWCFSESHRCRRQWK